MSESPAEEPTVAEVAVKGKKSKSAAKKPKVAKPQADAKRAAAAHPPYAAMVEAAIATLAERGGSSKQAVLKYILQHYDVGGNSNAVNAHVNACLKRSVDSGKLKQVKGTGASGSFKLAEKKAPKEATPKVKKSPAKKTVDVESVAPAAKKSPKIKKSPAKAAKAKSTAAAAEKILKKAKSLKKGDLPPMSVVNRSAKSAVPATEVAPAPVKKGRRKPADKASPKAAAKAKAPAEAKKSPARAAAKSPAKASPKKAAGRSKKSAAKKA